MTSIARVLRNAYVGFALIIATTLLTVASVIVMGFGAACKDEALIGPSLPATCISSWLSLIIMTITMGVCRSIANSYQRRRQIIHRCVADDPEAMQPVGALRWLQIVKRTLPWAWATIAVFYTAVYVWVSLSSVRQHIASFASVVGIPLYLTVGFSWFVAPSLIESISMVSRYDSEPVILTVDRRMSDS